MVLSQGTEARYHKRVVRIHSANDSQIDRRDNKGGSIRKGWYSFGEGNIFSILPGGPVSLKDLSQEPNEKWACRAAYKVSGGE